MGARVCLAADTHRLPKAGGHLWVYLHWALGLRAAGCEVVWLEILDEQTPAEEALARVRAGLEPFGLASALAACGPGGTPHPVTDGAGCLDLNAAAEADLVLDVGGKLEPEVLSRFRRSALVDIDPGLLQLWLASSGRPIAGYDVCFTIGETVGTPDATFPDLGVEWHHTWVPIHLPEWTPEAGPSEPSAPYTTVSSWWGWWEDFDGSPFPNEKRVSFLEYLELPGRVGCELELALALWGEDDHEEIHRFRRHGWRVRDAFEVADTPAAYRRYLEASRGEFSCAKPSCLRLRNAWLSDRTLAYMALGRPAVVQFTGDSRRIPDGDGILRFRSLDEAAGALEAVEADYARHARSARAFVEEHCDAAKVVGRVLERALG